MTLLRSLLDEVRVEFVAFAGVSGCWLRFVFVIWLVAGGVMISESSIFVWFFCVPVGVPGDSINYVM